MKEMTPLNVAGRLRGMPVLPPDTNEKLGEVWDVLVHPTEGRVLGLILHTSAGEERVLAMGDFLILSAAETVRAGGGRLTEIEKLSDGLANGVAACHELIGASVVTEAGKLLGRVCEVHIFVERPLVIYRVAASGWQRFFGSGFFMAGDVPYAYSREGTRLIVPAWTGDLEAASSLTEAIETLI